MIDEQAAASAPAASGPPRAYPAHLALLIAAVSTVGFCSSLAYPLLALSLKAQGMSTSAIALNAAMTPLGVILSAPVIPHLAMRLGAARCAIASSVAIAALSLFMFMFQNAALWLPARFMLGVAANGLLVIGEAWITQSAGAERRGRIVGLYASAMSLAFTVGPLVLAATGPGHPLPFIAIALVSLFAAASLWAERASAPVIRESKQAWSLQALVPFPIISFAVASFALFDQITLSLLPVYGLIEGRAPAAMALAISALNVGSIAFQFLIGWVADLYSRRAVLMLCAFTTAIGALSLPYVIVGDLFWPFLFVWGACAYGVKTLALIELGDRLSGEELVAGTAGLSVMRGLSGFGGTVLAGASMDHLGPLGLPALIAAIFGSLAAFTLASLAPSRQPVRQRARGAKR